MKYLLPILAVATLTSCSHFEGNGYKATFVMTDVKAYQQSADQVTVTGMKQTTVPVKALNVAQNISAGYFANQGIQALSNNSTREVLGQQQTVRSIAAGKEATKQMALTESTTQAGLKLVPPVVVPRP